jgi:hypothetical protein
MKPAMRTLLPVPTASRVEMLARLIAAAELLTDAGFACSFDWALRPLSAVPATKKVVEKKNGKKATTARLRIRTANMKRDLKVMCCISKVALPK